jgi:hypothetical protein
MDEERGEVDDDCGWKERVGRRSKWVRFQVRICGNAIAEIS